MRKFLSLMLLTLVTALTGFKANAATFTVEFSNVNAIQSIEVGPSYDLQSIAVAKTITWDSSIGDLKCYFKDGVEFVSVTSDPEATFAEYSDYYYNPYMSPTYVALYTDIASKVTDGAKFIITTEGGEPEAGGGGDNPAVPADKVRFQFTNPGGVQYVANAAMYGTEFPLEGNYVDLDPSSLTNVYTLFNDGVEVNSVTNSTTGTTFSSGNDYYVGSQWVYQPVEAQFPMLTFWLGECISNSKINLGDVILIDNGEDTSGGGTTTPTEWRYTFNSDFEIYLDANLSGWDWVRTDWSGDTKKTSILLVDGYTGYVKVQNYSDWSIADIVASDGTTLTPDRYGEVDVHLDQFTTSETFTVNFEGKYTFDCPIDALDFVGADGSPVTSTYTDGKYTVTFTNAQGGVTVSLKDALADKFTLASWKCTNITSGTGASGSNYTFSVSPTSKSGYNYEVSLKYKLVGTLSGTGEVVDGTEVAVKYGSSNFTYSADTQSYTIDRVTSASNAVSASSTSETLAVTSITYNGQTYDAVDGTATIPAGTLDILVPDFVINTEAVTPVVPENVWKFNCAENVLTFAQSNNENLVATYNAGAYSVTGLIFGPSLEITANGYNITAVTATDDSAVKPTSRVEGNKAIVTTYDYEGSATFDVTLAANTAITFKFSDESHIAGVYNGNNADGTELSLTNGELVVDGDDVQNIYILFNTNVEFKSLESPTGVIEKGDNTYITGGAAAEGTAYLHIYLANGKMRGLYEEGKTYTVTTEEFVTPVDKIVTITVTDQDYVKVTTNDGNTTLEFADNKTEFNCTELGNLIKIIATNGASYVNAVASAGTLNYPNGQYANPMVISLADVPNGATVSIGLNVPKLYTYTFSGMEGLDVTFNGTAATYADDTYTIAGIPSTSYGSVEVSVSEELASQYTLVGVTPDGGELQTPDSNGKVYLAVYEYPADTHFTIEVEEVVEKEMTTVTFTVVNGSPYTANVYDATTGKQIEFSSNAPTEVSFPKGNSLFIGKIGGDLYKLVVDGVEVPAELNMDQESFYNNIGYLLTEDGEYYPQNGGTVLIYQEAEKESYNVSFTFENDDTEAYVTGIKVGYTFLRDDDEGNAFSDALANGLTLDEDTNFELTFNNMDFSGTVTVNGTAITGDDYKTTIDGDLAFVFDVTKTGGVTVTVNCDGWEHITVTDPDQNSYDLTGASTQLSLSSTVERLFFKAKEGYVIPEGSVVAYYGSVSEKHNQGDGIFILNGNSTLTSVDVTVIADGENPSEGKSFTFACIEDVITFTGGTAGTGNPDRSEVDVTATYANGVYTVTPVPAYLTLTVNDDARADYVLESITNKQGTLTSQNGFSVEFDTSRFENGTEFTINFKDNTEPRYITVNVDNASCINRIFSENSSNITTFPAQYDLNTGTLLTVEAKSGCQIDGITIDDVDYNAIYPATTVTIDLEGVEEGAVVNISASTVAGQFTYTFVGAEGLKISYRAVDASFADGIYTLNNITDSSDYGLTIQVATGYENNIILESVNGNKTTWTPTGASGVINIPGSELPKADTEFVINTRVPAPSETVRTVYLTIDDTSVVQYGKYQGMSGYFSFNEDGVATLTIRPDEYAIEVVTTKSITAIDTDEEGTFTMPDLPATNVTLNLANAVEGQTINLYTEEITLRDNPEVTVDATAATATVTVKYSVSNSLVGETLTVYVNDVHNSTFVPAETSGEFTVIVENLSEGDNTLTITVKSEHAEDTVQATAALSGIDAVFMDEDGNEVDVYNLQGIKMKPGHIQPGFYIVNGRKVFIKH